MFHKSIGMDFAKITFYVGMLIVLLTLGTLETGFAQESSKTPSENQEQENASKSDTPDTEQDQGGYRTLDVLITDQDQEATAEADEDQADTEPAIPIPIQAEEDSKSLGAQAYVDDVFRSSRNRWGFSFSAYQAYTSALYDNSQLNQSSGITAFTPRTFFNFGKQKSKLHIDLGAGYRRYNRNRGLASWDYDGNVTYSKIISRQMRFELSNQFTSSFNDSWSFLSLYSPISYNPNFSNEVMFNRQRITRNSLQGNLAFQLTRRAQLDLFGGHRYYDYSRNSLGNANAYEAGAGLDLRITNWLYLANRYSAYLNHVDERIRNTQIHRLQVGGLDFRPALSWRLWVGGGVEFSRYRDRKRAHESINAGIGYTSRSTTISVTYHHGFTSAIGLAELLSSDIISAQLGHRITPWMRGSLQSYYYRSSELSGDGLLRTFSNGGGMEFSLCRNVVASLNAFYQNQNTRRFSIQGLGINRITGYVGLQYFWPARSERGLN